MYAVFFMSDTMTIDGVEDQSIHVFDDHEAADKFIFEGLVKAGRIDVTDGLITVDGESYEHEIDAIDAAQMQFGFTEYFHSYPVVDQRGETVAPVSRPPETESTIGRSE